ncbi:beta-glucosidase 16-like [Miscanthus floridulus]|uniref:beta-glucosidase 16-like n=1 Tax=Miscanthus floridulus TaxID=154761 RepID=UPI0034578585
MATARAIAAAATALAAVLVALLAPAARGVDRSEFPQGFLFGAATSAYQIEGAYLEDGKGLCNWDVFTHTHTGGIMDGRTGDVADDHYHRYMGDVEILQSLGVNAYRFSISWARILPRGRLGGVNAGGIAFYNRLIDALLQKGIQPFVTLNHFDVPHELEVRYVGWLGAGIREEYAYYADVCFGAFGDRVRFWTTFNEPNLFTKFQYMLGVYPPSHCSPPFGSCNSGDSHREPYAAAHNIIMSHAAAVRNYKDNYQAKQGGSIGIVTAMKWYEPLTNATEDILAARRAQSFETEWFLDPIFFGDYPRAMREILQSNLPTFTAEEKKLLLRYKPDFIGLNHYTAIYAKDCIHSPCNLQTYEGNAFVSATGERDGVKIGRDTALVGFYDVPEAIEPAIMYVNGRYKDTPVYITENGFSQWSDANREELINDVARKNYLQGYVTCLSKAVRNGANVRGYFVWTLLDNFEWTFGYSLRYGLYHVDFDTQERTPRMSARWYKGFLTGDTSLMTDQAQARRADS